MLRPFIALFSCCLLLFGCAPHIPRGPVPLEQAARPSRVITQPDMDAAVVHLQALIDAGSVRDPVGGEGLATLVGRGLLEGGAGDLDGAALRQALVELGGSASVAVGRDHTHLRMRCPAPARDACLTLFIDLLTRPRFEGAAVSALQMEALRGLGLGLPTAPARLGSRVAEGLLFEGHRYGHPPEGRAGVLPVLGPDRLRAFHQAHYVRQAVVVGIAGATSPELEARLADGLDALPGRASPERDRFGPPGVPAPSLTVVGAGDPETAHLVIGQVLDAGPADADWPALRLALQLLGHQAEGLAQVSLGLDAGAPICVEACGPEPSVLSGLRPPALLLRLHPVPPEESRQALSQLLATLTRLQSSPPEPAALHAARAHLLDALRRQGADPEVRLALALRAEADALPDPLDPAPLEAVDAEAVALAAREHLHLDRLRIVAVTGDPPAVVDRLLEGPPGPFVYAPDRDGEPPGAALALTPEHTWTLDPEGIFR